MLTIEQIFLKEFNKEKCTKISEVSNWTLNLRYQSNNFKYSQEIITNISEFEGKSLLNKFLHLDLFINEAIEKLEEENKLKVSTLEAFLIVRIIITQVFEIRTNSLLIISFSVISQLKNYTLE